MNSIIILLTAVSGFFALTEHTTDITYKQFNAVYAIYRAADTALIDPELAVAVAYTESRLRQDRVSTAGAVGIMQLMPIHQVDRYCMYSNIEYGVHYLAYLIHRYGEAEGLRRYNGGWRAKESKAAHYYAATVLDLYNTINRSY